MSLLVDSTPVQAQEQEQKSTQEENSSIEKFVVSGLLPGTKEHQLKDLFSQYGNVMDVAIDGVSAKIVINKNVDDFSLDNLKEIMLDNVMLILKRDEEASLADSTTVCEAPLYIAGGASFNASYMPYQEDGSYYGVYGPSQTSYSQPVWVQSVHQADAQQTNFYPLPSSTSGTYPSLIAHDTVSSGFSPVAVNTAMFPFESSIPQNFQYSSRISQIQPYSPSSARSGSCHVCSGNVSMRFPQSTHQSTSQGGHQLQPLTPITPSIPPSGFILPPTSGPVNLTPMTPTFYLPPSPSFTTPGANIVAADGSFYDAKALNNFTNLKLLKSTNTEANANRDKQDCPSTNYFTSPFKTFSKFRGQPVQPRFPFKSTQGSQFIDVDGEDISSWYQQGDRWGHRSINLKENKDSKVEPYDEAKE